MSPRVRLVFGCVLISFSSIFARLASVPSTVSAFYRVGIGSATLLVLWFATGARFGRSPVRWPLLLAAAAFFAVDLGMWHRSIEYVGPGLSTLLASLQVFFMAGAGRLFFRQKLTRTQLLALPLAFGGLALLIGFDGDKLASNYGVGVVLGVLTGLTYAGFMLCLRQAQSATERRLPIAELCTVSLGTSAFLAAAATVEGSSLRITEPLDLLWLGCLGVLCHVGGWLAIASSLPRVPTAVAGLTLTLQPVMTLVWDILIFGRGLTALEAIGALVTVVAIYLGSRSRKTRAS